MGIFDDGTPLDAASLQDLDRRLVEIKASIPKVGSSTDQQSQSLENKTISAKQIVGGISPKVPLTPGKNTPFRIDFGSGIESTPKAVIITPIRSSDIPATFTFAVDNKTLSSSGVDCRAYLNSAAKGGFNLYFYWILICH